MYSVNEKKPYHNCEMVFTMEYENPDNGFRVDDQQEYKIFTTLKEVAVLDQALQLFQKEGFKSTFLKYTAVQDGSAKYPAFVVDYIDAVELGKQLQSLANDEDSLVQLSEYCLEIPPTYEDDFYINKHIKRLIVENETYTITDDNSVEDVIETLQERQPSLFA